MMETSDKGMNVSANLSGGSMKLRMALACGLLLSSDWGLAQNQAQQNLQQQQWQLEQTRRGYQAQQDAYAAAAQQQLPPPPRPTGKWIKTWGAIAANDKGDGGVAIGKLTKKEAEAEAVRQCLTWGGGGCKPTLVYQNQCAAGAVPNAGSSNGRAASASSPDLAKQVALKACSDVNGGATCKIIYSACSDPIFRHY